MTKILRRTMAAVSLSLLISSGAAAEDNEKCDAVCNKPSEVTVNLEKKCMCLEGKDGKKDCFKINIGSNGPSMTTQGGPAKLRLDKGAKYQSKPLSETTESYDNDMIAMGIPENDKVGKWIHKTQGCGPGGREATKGCIAVPCEHWKEVKEKVGEDLTVCGGGGPVSNSSGSSGGSQQGGGYQQ